MTINYELAKQLKEAGFPQQEPSFYEKFHATGQQEKDGYPYTPTLSELIEAIPMRHKYLGTTNDAHFVLRKLVSAGGDSYWAYMEDEDTGKEIDGYSFKNEPADVVVARLLLALLTHTK